MLCQSNYKKILTSLRFIKKCFVSVELSDESGNIKFLRECPNRYASEMLTDRESLVLLRVESMYITDYMIKYLPWFVFL